MTHNYIFLFIFVGLICAGIYTRSWLGLFLAAVGLLQQSYYIVTKTFGG